MSFVHLHCHTEGSLLDGMCRSKDLATQAAKFDMPAVACTDHGVMYNVVQFAEDCNNAGVKPIIGCEVYVAPGSRTVKEPVDGERYYHMLLLAQNEVGYRNLVQMVSKAYVDGFYYKPRVDKELINAHSDGIVATSSCLGGELSSTLLKGEYALAEKRAAAWREVFGRDKFFIEVQNHGLPEQDATTPDLVKIARHLSLPLVATNDVHYLRQQDAEPHEILLCIQTGRTLSDPNRLRYGPPAFFLRDADDMKRRFAQIPEACENTLRIADMCSFNFEFGKHHLPKFDVPSGFDANSYLEKLCRDQIPNTYKEHTQEIEDRLKYELGIISSKGFASYLLIVWDYTHYARSNGIMAQARGSAAGSLVAYLLGLTNIDPLRYNLMFERFMNPDRKSLPDIDLDIADTKRDQVIQYCKDKYGEDHVAQIITFGTMAAKSAVNDAGRALEYPIQRVERITKMISPKPGVTLDGSLENDQNLRDLYDGDEAVKKLIDTARQVEGLYRHAGIHAAGIVITAEPTITYAPVQTMTDGRKAIQYGMEDAEKIGLVKMDMLGLRNLSVIDRTLELIRKRRGLEIDLDAIPHNDEPAFRLLQRGDTIGIFQFESGGMQRLLRALRPDRIEDLIALVALYRPGPLQSGMDRSYIERKHGREPVSYLHPLLEPILDASYGIILYQEQIMRITMSMAGFGPGQAEAAMKGMAKKKPEVIAKLRVDFAEGCKKKGIPDAVATQLYEVMANFASYGFNMNHSGAYGMLAYHTAYLKANFPHEFMCANVSTLADKKDRLSLYCQNILSIGIEISEPDVNKSGRNFKLDGQRIVMGLGAIKGLREDTITAIIQERKSGAYTSLEEFVSRIGRRAVVSDFDALIKAGALDRLGDRVPMLYGLEQMMADLRKGWAGNQARPAVKLHAPKALPELSLAERLAMEGQTVGIYLSGHPLQGVEDQLRAAVTANAYTLPDLRDGDEVTVGGVIHSITVKTTKRQEKMAQVVLEDMSGHIEVTLFPKVFAKCQAMLIPAEVLLVKGRIHLRQRQDDEGSIQAELFAESLSTLNGEMAEHETVMHVEGDAELFSVLDQEITNMRGSVQVIYHRGEGSQPAASQIALIPAYVREVMKTARKHSGHVWFT